MSAQQCGKTISTNAAKLLTEIWPYSSDTSQKSFFTSVLSLPEGDIPSDDNQRKLKVMSAANTVTFNDLMTIIDTSKIGWQSKMAFICDTAKAQSNANKLDELTKLTLLSLECRPITIQPPVYSAKVKIKKFKNFNQNRQKIENSKIEF